MNVNRICFCALFAGSLLFASQGTVPLQDAKSYPNRTEVDGIGIGAAVLTGDQVKQRFVTEFTQDYLVVEVALYPKDGVETSVEPERFVLRAGKDRAMRSENPKVIAAALQQADQSRRNIDVVPQVGVGHETGGVRYDPTTGTYRRSGWYTSTGVAVIVGDPSSPPPNPKNEEVMALELTEKGLPSGAFQKPVAGHLYFRIGKDAAKDKHAKYELGYEIHGKEGRLPLK